MSESSDKEGRGRALRAGALVGAALTGDLTIALLEVNGLPLITLNGGRFLVVSSVLAGIPGSLVFVALLFGLRRVLKDRRESAIRWLSTAVIGLHMLAVVYVGLSAGLSEGALAFQRHLLLSFSMLLLIFSGRSRRHVTFPGRAAISAGLFIAAVFGLSWTQGLALTWPDPPREVERGVPLHRGKTVLIGVDGLCWDFLNRWEKAGGSEDLAWFREHSLIGPLGTYSPTQSPSIWTTIATGRGPEQHGILGFTSWQAAGIERTFGAIPRYAGAFYWLRAARALGLIRLKPVSSLDVRCPPYWEILAAPDRPVSVAGWWCTWPALPTNGRVFSDKFFFWREEARGSFDSSRATAVTYPEELDREFAGYKRAPESISDEELLRFVDLDADELEAFRAGGYEAHDVRSELPMAYAMDETYFAVADRLVREAPDRAVLSLYFRGIDITEHAALYASTLYPESGASDEDRRRYGRLVESYYEYTFDKLRKLVETIGDDAVVMIVSDHGFEEVAPGEYGHDDAPDGVIIVPHAWKGARFGDEKPDVYDVAPTLLWLEGYPPARDMRGRALREVFPHLDVRGKPPERTASYGYRWARAPVRIEGSEEADEEMLELLRSLGYIQ